MDGAAVAAFGAGLAVGAGLTFAYMRATGYRHGFNDPGEAAIGVTAATGKRDVLHHFMIGAPLAVLGAFVGGPWGWFLLGLGLWLVLDDFAGHVFPEAYDRAYGAAP